MSSRMAPPTLEKWQLQVCKDLCACHASFLTTSIFSSNGNQFIFDGCGFDKCGISFGIVDFFSSADCSLGSQGYRSPIEARRYCSRCRRAEFTHGFVRAAVPRSRRRLVSRSPRSARRRTLWQCDGGGRREPTRHPAQCQHAHATSIGKRKSGGRRTSTTPSKPFLAQSRSLAVDFGIFPFHLRQQIFTDKLLQDPKYFLLMELTSAIINMPVPPTWGTREELG